MYLYHYFIPGFKLGLCKMFLLPQLCPYTYVYNESPSSQPFSFVYLLNISNYKACLFYIILCLPGHLCSGLEIQ